MAARINHVSVNARDLATSVAFYADLLGAEEIPTPNFGIDVRWLALGDTQLHLFQRDVEPPSNHHFAVTVDELEPVYHRAAELRIFDRETFRHHLIELPGDIAQMYVRDPTGNLLEIDAAGASRLQEPLRSDMRRLADMQPQSEDNLRGRLFVGGAASAGEPSRV
jgi:catechol 2,3-dioxygenase-like lactoylglutathione lyase family enzyme